VLDKNGEEIDLRAEDEDAAEGEMDNEYVHSDGDFSAGGFTLEDDDGNPIAGDDSLFSEEELFQSDDFADEDF